MALAAFPESAEEKNDHHSPHSTGLESTEVVNVVTLVRWFSVHLVCHALSSLLMKTARKGNWPPVFSSIMNCIMGCTFSSFSFNFCMPVLSSVMTKTSLSCLYHVDVLSTALNGESIAKSSCCQYSGFLKVKNQTLHSGPLVLCRRSLALGASNLMLFMADFTAVKDSSSGTLVKRDFVITHEFLVLHVNVFQSVYQITGAFKVWALLCLM